MAIVAVSVRTGSKRLSGIAVAFPVTIKTVIVSPIALPNPKIQAAIIPEPAAGNTTFNMLTHLFPPKAYDASLNDWGTDRKASSRSEEHTSELQSRPQLVCRPLLEKKN